jgi:hypothetical protein
MKKLWVAAITMAMFLGIQAYGEVQSVNVVGVMTLEVPAGESDTISFLSVPMTKLPVARGTIAGNGDDTITADNVTWAENIFAVGGDAGGANDEAGVSTYYVEITSGLFEGRHFYIAGNDSDTLTLAAEMGDVAPGELAGAGYKIISANRIRDIFGEPGTDDVKVLGAASSADADQIRVWDTVAGTWSSPIFYKDSGRGDVDLYVGVEDADNYVIDRDLGVLVRTKGVPDRTPIVWSVTGEVSGNQQAIVIESGAALLGGMVAVDTPIKDAGLNPPVLKGGSSSAEADTIFYWDADRPGSPGWSAPVFYKDSGRGDVDVWVSGGEIVDDTFILKAGKAYFFRVGPDSDGNLWSRTSPLQ